MTEFNITCPECSTVVVTNYPEAMIWERCPACRHHVWEAFDLMMAEVVVARSSDRDKADTFLRTHNN